MMQIHRIIFHVNTSNLLSHIFFFLPIVFLTGCEKKLDGLNLRVLDKEIRINHNKGKINEPCATTCADVHFSLNNESDINWILYDFKSKYYYGIAADSSYCGGGAAERVMFIYNQKNEQIFASTALPYNLHETQMTYDRLLDSHNQIKERFLLSKQVINSHRKVDFVQNIDFREFDLKPGVYHFKLLYFQNDVSNYITIDQSEIDKKRFDGEIYRGCLWSNPVRLIVD